MRLADVLTPYLERAVRVGRRQVRKEMVFHCLDYHFCCVDAMIVGFDQLDFRFIGLDIRSDCAGSFIVEDMEGWLMTVGF